MPNFLKNKTCYTTVVLLITITIGLIPYGTLKVLEMIRPIATVDVPTPSEKVPATHRSEVDDYSVPAMFELQQMFELHELHVVKF